MKIQIPEDISDITLNQYQRYTKLMERTDLDAYNLNKRIIEIFCGIPFNDIDNIDSKDYAEIISSIEIAVNKDSAFVNRFEIDGFDFGFIPNLDDMSAKELMDLSSHGMEVENLHKVMAVLFRPIKGTDKFNNYTIHSYDGTKEFADFMKKTPMNVVNGALIFFSSLAKELQKHIQKFTEMELVKENQQTSTLRSGIGQQQSMN